MKRMSIILFTLVNLVILNAQAKGISLAKCATIDDFEIDGKEVVYFEVVGGQFYGDNKISYPGVDFFGSKVKLIQSAYGNDWEGSLRYNKLGGLKSVTIKRKGEKKIIFKVTKFTVTSRIPFFNRGRKHIEADCELRL